MKREMNIDSLRVIAIIMVVILHSFAIFIIANFDKFNFDLKLSTSIAVFTRVAVPLFVMVSGRYLMDCLSKISIKDFYVKRANRVLYPLLFWSVIYSGYKMFFVEGSTVSSVVVDFFVGTPYIHLWFLYMIFGLYLVTPLLYKIKNKLSTKGYVLFSVVSLLIAPVFEMNMKIQILQLFTYIGYFTMGDILKDFVVGSKGKIISLLGYFASMFVAVGLTVYFIDLKNDVAFMFSSGTVYTTMIGAISLYVFFNGLDNKESKLSKVSKYTMGIYCIHYIILEFLSRSTNEVLTGIMVLDASLYAIITFLISWVIIYYLSKVEFSHKWLGI